MPRSKTLPPPRPFSNLQIRATVLSIARQHGVRSVRVFGSFARGKQTNKSDLDLLVELPEKSSLLDLVGLKQDLEEALHRKVDVLTERGLNRHRRERILQEARPL